jgi:pyruvate kinase
MMRSGMDVARLNFSHGTHAEHHRRMEAIRRLNGKYRRHVRILQDLEGYRIRIGSFKDGKPMVLKKRQAVRLTNKEARQGEGAIPFDYRGNLKEIKAGNNIFIDDGNIALVVTQVTAEYVNAEVVFGGVLKEHKGINMPEVNFRFKGLTEKDARDARFGLDNKVDFIAQSFVRDKKDILHLRKLVEGAGRPGCRIIAKIENRQGIANIDEILEVSDGIMIARGDMGVSVPVYEVPMIQKYIIRKCNLRKKFVITATQMLESMTEHPRPSRAEVADVANAILDGSDYVMLSGETAAGAYPVEAVRMMDQVIKFTEAHRYTL